MGSITSSLYDLIYYSSPDFEEFFDISEGHHYVVRADNKLCFGFDSKDDRYIAGVFRDNTVYNGLLCDADKAVIYVDGQRKLTYILDKTNENTQDLFKQTIVHPYSGC